MSRVIQAMEAFFSRAQMLKLYGEKKMEIDLSFYSTKKSILFRRIYRWPLKLAQIFHLNTSNESLFTLRISFCRLGPV